MCTVLPNFAVEQGCSQKQTNLWIMAFRAVPGSFASVLVYKQAHFTDGNAVPANRKIILLFEISDISKVQVNERDNICRWQ